MPCLREDDILILDPESEFGSLVEALNGEVISISATSHTHLNALDMDSRNPKETTTTHRVVTEEFLPPFLELVGGVEICPPRREIQP